MPTGPPLAAQPKAHVVRDFKGMHAVFRGDRLVTRTADEDAAKAYAASADAAPADRKPFASKIEKIHDDEF